VVNKYRERHSSLFQLLLLVGLFLLASCNPVPNVDKREEIEFLKPLISGISPSIGSASGGTLVTITGKGFEAGTAVSIAGAACNSVNIISLNQLTCMTSAAPAGVSDVLIVKANGDSVVGENIFTYQTGPAVSSVSPSAGPLAGGTLITLTGTNFVAGASVDLGSVACTGVTVVSATSITCTTAAQAAGAVNITVTNPSLVSSTLLNGYTYQPAPTVTSLSPTGGALAGGNLITVNGTGFVAGATVDLGGSACGGVTVVSSTQITCTTTAHAAGAVTATVTNADTQSGNLAAAFTYQAAPTVTAIAPTSGFAVGTTAVTITGTGFLAGATVDLGGSACTSVTVVSPTSITCTTAAHAAGTVAVTVTNSDTQNGNLAAAYTYVNAPTVSSVSPNAGALAGGTAVTINGAFFSAGATVDLGGSACTGVAFVSANQLTCNTTAHVAGAVTATVTNPDTQNGTLASAYTYQAAPTVTSVSPNAGALAGGTTITVNGTGFLAGATVDLGGSNCGSVTVVSPTQITCTTTAHAAGAVTATVTNADSQNGNLAAAYTYQTAPTVSAVAPGFGGIAGGTAITITGTGFLAGATVDLSGSACTGVTVVSATSITCTTSAHAAGPVNVTVTNSDTQSGYLSSGYTYLAAPTIAGITPVAGALAGGTALTIVGTGFYAGATVDIGGSACTGVTVVSTTTITCTTSARAAGTVNVTVTNPDTQNGVLASIYTYQGAPTVTSISPVFSANTGGQFVTITGTGFITGATVNLGGATCISPVVVNPTTITCTNIAGAAGVVATNVVNPDNQVGSLASSFEYLASPTVTAIAPTSGFAAGGTAVTITGTGFYAGATVRIGTANCTGVTVVSPTSITCTTSADTAGLTAVTVTNVTSQVGNLFNGYTYVAAPTVTTIAPAAGQLAGTDMVTVLGTGFLAGATVDFGGSACTGVVVVSPTNITCTTTAHAAGAVTVTVTNTDTQNGTLASGFTYQPAPTVTAVAPNGGPLAGGTAVTITGTGFVTGAVVDLGGSACTSPTVVNSTTITCTTPAGAAGAVTATVTNADAQTGNLGSAFTYRNAPTVTSISPSAGPTAGGTAVTITGTNFLAGATATIGGANCTGLTVVSATSITCTTGAAAAGLQNVVVTNTDTQNGTLTNGYLYLAPPTVTSVSPNAGALAGGTAVTITGTAFVAGATVDFGGSACTGVTVVNATTITCTTAAHAAGAVTVTITNPDTQNGNLASAYTYQAAPTVTSIAPNAGALAGGTAITITGTGFVAGAAVDLGGSACTGITVVSATSITCTTAAHAAGAVTATVTNADTQSGNLASAYTYQAAPTVTAVSPSAGALAGGTAITITGTGFLAGATVDFGGSACGGVTVVSPTSITCTTTAHAAGAVTVSVTNTDTQSGSLASSYTYQAAPTVTSISPSSGALTGGTAITITGTGFLTGATVDLGGSACTGITVVSSTSITCTTAAHAAGAVTATVTNTDTQNGNLASAYTYQAAPTVSAISPSIGSTTGGTNVSITGTDFLAGATVTIGGASCGTLTVVSPTLITCTTSARAAGLVDIVVTNADTQSGTLFLGYLYLTPPTVSSVSPNAGALAGGTAVTIVGTGFVAGATVDFGGSACTGVTVVSATMITCTTAAHAAGATTLTVTNPDTQSGNLASAYTYQAAPTVTSVAPNAGALAGGTAITITGTGFLSGATVDLGGSTCTSVVVVSTTSITCTTSAHAAGAVNVTVTNADTQNGALASGYTYQAAPTVTSVSPNAGNTAGGTAVTITGTGFLAGATVDFSGAACTGVTVVSATSITCTTGAHAAASATVTVTNTDTQTGALAAAYTYQPPPTVTSLDVTTGLPTGGTAVTITGTGFLAGATVDFGGSACASVTVVSTTSITCTTTAHAAGAVTVTVTNADTQNGALAAAFTYQSMAVLQWQVGAASPNPPNPDNYGTVSVNVTHTYTLQNIGDTTSGTITISKSGAASGAWLFGTDNCNGNTLAAGATCTVQMTFLGGLLGSGAYSASLDANATGTSSTNAVQGTIP
jgi:hypothetical protein